MALPRNRRRQNEVAPNGGPMITHDTVRELAAQQGEPSIATVYLDVDGEHRPRRVDYEDAFERLADELRRRARALPGSRPRGWIEGDIGRMRTALADDLDRSQTRGVAMFSCSERDFFEALPLPRPVRDQVTLAPRPHVAQLLAVLNSQERVVVTIVDRQRVRLFRMEFGAVDELEPIFEPEPRAVDTSIELGSWEHHSEEAARVHFRAAATRVHDALQAWPASRLIIGGPDEARAALERNLPAVSAVKIIGRMDARVAAPIHEIAALAREIEQTAESRRKSAAIEQLRQHAAEQHGAVVGLDPTLQALAERRVATLFVQEGFAVVGARCPACGHLGVDVRQCPTCGTTNVEIEDVVEAAIESAVAQHADIEFCDDDELRRFGSIGALERY